MGVLNAMSDSVLVMKVDDESTHASYETMPNILFSNASSSKLFGANLNSVINPELGDNLSQTQIILPQFIELENPYKQGTQEEIQKLDKLREEVNFSLFEGKINEHSKLLSLKDILKKPKINSGGTVVESYMMLSNTVKNEKID